MANLETVHLGTSGIEVAPICLGGNVFGWTADRDESFDILDAFVDGGGTFIDTADVYSAWVDGNSGGESESIIGEWLALRKPADVVVATKVSKHPEFPGLSAEAVRGAVRASLTRLGVPQLDILYAHFDDEQTPLEETVAVFDECVRAGLVREVALSNYREERIRQWLEIARATGARLPVALQPHYNLVERGIERDILPLAEAEQLAVLPYFSLASGFLTGKYTSTTDASGSARESGVAKYVTPKNLAVVDAARAIADARGIAVATVALAWLRQQPAVTAPIASASRATQVADLLASATTELTPDELAELTRLSA